MSAAAGLASGQSGRNAGRVADSGPNLCDWRWEVVGRCERQRFSKFVDEVRYGVRPSSGAARCGGSGGLKNTAALLSSSAAAAGDDRTPGYFLGAVGGGLVAAGGALVVRGARGIFTVSGGVLVGAGIPSLVRS